MKKYFILIIVSLIIGFLLSIYVINQYDNKKSITVYREGKMLYFFKYGEFNSVDEMEEKTINLENYIYRYDNNVYKVYIAITKSLDNVDKIKKFYKDYNIDVENYYIANNKYLDKIDNLDNILKNTDDNIVIGEIISQQLSSYDEVVNNGHKN